MLWRSDWVDWHSDPASSRDYVPSGASLRTPGCGAVVGQFPLLAAGYAAFQVFTVAYVEATRCEAEVWNTYPPDSVNAALSRIWPRLLGGGIVSWWLRRLKPS